MKTLWLWWFGPSQSDLDVCWRAYLRRFDIEHTFRFAKATLGWTTPALRTPEQADRWTWLLVVAYTQLRRARGFVEDLRLPWQRPKQPTLLTPSRVRRGFRVLRATIDTPAHPPKSDKPPAGTTQRHPTTTTRPLPSSKDNRLTAPQRFKRKLSYVRESSQASASAASPGRGRSAG